MTTKADAGPKPKQRHLEFFFFLKRDMMSEQMQNKQCHRICDVFKVVFHHGLKDLTQNLNEISYN